MSDLESALGIPVAVQKMLRTHGICPEAFDSHHRVRPAPLLKAIGKILSDRPLLLDEPLPEYLNAEQEKARLDKARREQIEIETLEKKGELCTRDGVDERLGPYLEAIAAGWRKFPKETGGKMRALLASAGVAADVIEQTITLAVAGVDQPIDAVRQLVELKKKD